MDGGVQSGTWGLSTGYGSDDGHHGVHNPDIRETVGVAVNIRCVEEMAHACPRPAKFIRESYFHWPQITRTDVENPPGTERLCNGYGVPDVFVKRQRAVSTSSIHPLYLIPQAVPR